MIREGHRSDKYQYLLLEVSCETKFFDVFQHDEGIYSPHEDEDLDDLRKDLGAALIRLAKSVLTEHQWEVLSLRLEGFTQMEIAKKLKVNQSSITKTLCGNKDYNATFGPKGKSYGGIFKKLKKAVAINPEIQNILEKISQYD